MSLCKPLNTERRVYGCGDNPVFRKLRNEYRYTMLLLLLLLILLLFLVSVYFFTRSGGSRGRLDHRCWCVMAIRRGR